MEIKKCSLIGLGALGVMFGSQLSQNMPEGDFRVIADQKRIDRYRRDGVYSNGARCDFTYVTPEQDVCAADLILIAVKFGDLAGALDAIQNHVRSDTVILSLLNGISSEEIIGDRYGRDKVLPCVAQGMDAMKAENLLTYQNMGMLVFGETKGLGQSEQVQRVDRFFEKTHLPHKVIEDIEKRMWGKFMLNVGLNQTTAVYGCTYSEVQKEGPLRAVMVSAMREVIELSQREGIFLTEDDLGYWLHILSTLNPGGKPSMAQDLEAKRRSEVELFSGTVIRLSRKHGIDCPVNRSLYEEIMKIESSF